MLWSAVGQGTTDHFGSSIASVGDVNGDGVADVAVGATCGGTIRDFYPLAPVVRTGYVRIMSGVDGSTIETITAPTPNSMFGSAIAALGDITGDGVPEIAVSAILDTAGGVDAGAVYIISLTPLGTALGAGSVLAPSGAPEAVLLVNGGSGEADRRVEVGIGQPFSISMQQPQAALQPTPFAVWGVIGVPAASALYPSSAGTFLFPPRPLDPYVPWLFTLTNNLWSDGTALVTSAPTPWGIAVNTGVPLPMEITLQGLVLFPGFANLLVTNAIALKIN